MTREKSAQMRNSETDTILIPELEEAIERGNTGKFGYQYTDREENILEKYYGKVDTKLLLPHLPGRTIGQIHSKAARMGITGRRG